MKYKTLLLIVGFILLIILVYNFGFDNGRAVTGCFYD